MRTVLDNAPFASTPLLRRGLNEFQDMEYQLIILFYLANVSSNGIYLFFELTMVVLIVPGSGMIGLGAFGQGAQGDKFAAYANQVAQQLQYAQYQRVMITMLFADLH